MNWLSRRESERAAEVHGVVGAKAMRASGLGRGAEERLVDGVAVQTTPDDLQILEGLVQLSRRQAAPLAHPDQRGRCLHARDRRGADAVGLGVCGASLVGSGLVDQQLDQRARVEVEAQRRPSETYSAALLPVPRSLAGFDGR